MCVLKFNRFATVFMGNKRRVPHPIFHNKHEFHGSLLSPGQQLPAVDTMVMNSNSPGFRICIYEYFYMVPSVFTVDILLEKLAEQKYISNTCIY